MAARAGELESLTWKVTIPVHNRNTGEVDEAAVFVAVMGFSSYTIAEAT